MSRIGKQPIEIPDGVNVAVDPGRVTVNGPLGELTQNVPVRMKIDKADGTLVVTRPTDRGDDRALHGLTRSAGREHGRGCHARVRRLQIQGVGYRAALRGTALELNVGFSHTVVVDPPARITFDVPVPTEVVVKESTSSRWARSPPRSGPFGPRACRARASTTKGSTCAARLASAPNGRSRNPSSRAPPLACAKRVSGTAERPRLVVFRSNRGITAQLGDDLEGKTLAAAAGCS